MNTPSIPALRLPLQTNTRNQYFPIQPVTASLFSTGYVNAGNIQNTGIEFTVGYAVIRERDFTIATVAAPAGLKEAEEEAAAAAAAAAAAEAAPPAEAPAGGQKAAPGVPGAVPAATGKDTKAAPAAGKDAKAAAPAPAAKEAKAGDKKK